MLYSLEKSQIWQRFLYLIYLYTQYWWKRKPLVKLNIIILNSCTLVKIWLQILRHYNNSALVIHYNSSLVYYKRIQLFQLYIPLSTRNEDWLILVDVVKYSNLTYPMSKITYLIYFNSKQLTSYNLEIINLKVEE